MKQNNGTHPSDKNKNQRSAARSSPHHKPANPSPPPPSRIPKTVKVNALSASSGSQSLQESSDSSNKVYNMSQGEGKAGPQASNAEMWASVMAKLDSMQEQQNSALQEIKEEIKVTNAGFSRDIALLRTDLDEVKNKLSDYDSKWEGLDKFRQDIMEDVKKQIISHSTQVTQEVKEVKQNILVDVQKQLHDQSSQLEDKLQDERADARDEFVEKREFLKEKGFNRRLNLILLGLAEPTEEGDEKDNVSSVLQNRLSIAAPKIDSVYRLGKKAEGKRPRPVMITFSKWYSRCNVWFAKSKINEGQDNKMRLQEDLPPQLRWELSILLKILRQAKSMPEAYPNARIKDSQIIINGTSYGVEDLDILPQDLQPAAIATPQSADAVAFFGRDSPFSNHFPCAFEYGGLSFNCMEQYLACQKAKLANNRSLASKIMRSSDPADHKRALNQLKDAVAEQWDSEAEEILMKGLRAKFRQDEYLYKLLLATYPRKLGEASRDPVWGIGLSLQDEKVLDVNEWSPEGNLLGKSLEAVREELVQEQSQAQNGSNTDHDPSPT